MNSKQTVSSKLRTWLLAGVASMIATPALAQAAPEQITTAQAAADPATDVEEAIVVTGSRIKRAGIDTVYPALSVGSEEIDKRAFTNVAEALNELPSFGENAQSSAGPQNNTLVGQNYADFLNLGSQRTLTLVNGRRFVSSNPPGGSGGSGLQVDLNVLPLALVERIETIGVGGAPIYGSDAIAGTVNLILRDNYEGLDLTTQYGITERGDSQEYRVQFLSGGNFADGRGNATIAVEYTKNNGLGLGKRPLYTNDDPYYAQDQVFKGDRVFRIYRNQQVDTFTAGGIVSPTTQPYARGSYNQGALADGKLYRFDKSGNLVPFVAGLRAPDNSPIWAQGGDGLDLQDISSQILSPLKRLVLSGNTRYDVTDNVRAFVEFQVANSEARELANQDGFQTQTGPGGEYGPLRFPTTYPFLTPQAQGILTSNGLSQFMLNRYHTDIYNTSWESETFLWRIAAGLNGKFNVGDRPFTWEASYVRGENDFRQGGTMLIDARFLNAIDVVRLTPADIAAVPAGRSILTFSGTPTANVGDIVCRAALQAAQGTLTGVSGSGVTDRQQPNVTGCVPLNLLGENTASAAAIDFVTGPENAQSSLSQTVYNFNVGGELFDLPAGPLAVNVGYETRKEAGSYTPETALEIGLGRHEPVKPTSGNFTTKEFFGEAAIPLVNAGMEIPFLRLAEATAAFRRIDNSVTGTADVWTVGGRVSFVKGLTVRGNYTKSIRAPSIGELYAPVVTIFSQANDPCDALFSNQGSGAGNRQANCRADITGYSATSFNSLVRSTSRLGRTGGNPNLENETARAWTVGATLEPTFLPNALLTVDYINIDIENAITSLTLTQIMNACYDGPSPTSSNPACSQFRRDATGQIVDFQTGQTNAQLFSHESLTYRAAYSFDLGRTFGSKSDLGEIGLNFNLHHTLKRDTSVVGEIPLATVGSYLVPRLSASFDTSWQWDNVRLFWRTLWRPAATIDLTGTRTYEDENGKVIKKAGGVLMHNASVSFDLDGLVPGSMKGASIQLSVNNVLNDKPNTEDLALGYFSLAQQLGRSYSIRLRTSF